jgi:hypothetical protein
MHTHPELADDPQFLPLFAHRTAPNVAGKNSGNKANKEASQVSITSGAITGCVSSGLKLHRHQHYTKFSANRTLIQHGVKTDPPGRFARLSLNEESGASLSFTPRDNSNESLFAYLFVLILFLIFPRLRFPVSDSGTGNESPSPEIEKSLANKQPGAKQVCVPLPGKALAFKMVL